MARRQRSGLGTVVVSVVLIVAAFVTATVVPLRHLRDIQQAAVDIETDAVPSLEELVAARRSIERIERVGTSPGAGDVLSVRARLRAHAADLQRHIDRYRALPGHPAERIEWHVFEPCMHTMLSVIDSWTPSAESRQALDAAVDCEHGFILNATELNAEHIRRFADDIETVRSAAWRTAVALNALGVVIAGVLLWWASRAVRRSAAAEQRTNALLEARALELEMFARRVAHDLVAPLAPARLWLERLLDADDAFTRRAVGRALSSIGNVVNVVDGLLAFARSAGRSGPSSHSDIDEIAREVIASFEEAAAAKGVQLQLTSPGPTALDVHRGIVSSVLSNLVQNAIRYIGTGASLRVTVRIHDRGERVRIEVNDTGPGIPEHLRKAIFEPYFRASESERGLGLGLATAKRLVEAYDGTIGVESTGEGSTFWFELPRSREPQAPRRDLPPA